MKRENVTTKLILINTSEEYYGKETYLDTKGLPLDICHYTRLLLDICHCTECTLDYNLWMEEWIMVMGLPLHQR